MPKRQALATGDDVIDVTAPDDGVVTMTLNRPSKRNALSIAVRNAMSDELDRLADDASVKVVIVTGAGDVFCAGFDLKEFDGLDDPAFAKMLWDSSDRWHRRILTFPLPLVAAINGPALAGGFDLAIMCDVRVAATTARFAHPEITFGDVVYGPLHDAVGGAVARELCLTGREVDADEAKELGLVSSVLPREDVLDECRRLAALMTRAPRDVLVRTKAKAVRRAGVAGATLDL